MANRDDDLETVPADKLCEKCGIHKRMWRNSLCALCAREEKEAGKNSNDERR